MLFRTRREPLHPLDAPRGWDVAVGRLRRGVDRYYEKVALMPDRRLRVELRELGAGLIVSLDQIAAVGADPRTCRDPVMQRAVSRAATLCAHATEAAMLARMRAGTASPAS